MIRGRCRMVKGLGATDVETDAHRLASSLESNQVFGGS